ncbi:ribosome-associated gtpase, partial [Cystoisospora suis]
MFRSFSFFSSFSCSEVAASRSPSRRKGREKERKFSFKKNLSSIWQVFLLNRHTLPSLEIVSPVTTEGVLRVAGKRSLERRSFVLFNEKHIFSQRNRFFFSPSSSSSSFSFSSPSSSSFSSFFRQHGNALFSKTPLSLALSYLSASSSSSSSHSLPVEKWPSLSLRRETSVSSSPSFRDKRRLKLFFLSSEKAFPSLFTSPFSRREEFSHLSSSSTSASPRRLLLSAPSLLASSPPISSSFSSSSSCGKISLPHRLHEDRNCRELSSFSSSSPSPLFSFSRFQSSLSSAALPFSSLRQFASKERQDQRNPVRKERRNVATCFAFGRDNPRSRPLHTSNSKVRRIEEEDREGGEGGEEEERRVRRKVRRVERRRLVQGLFSQRKRLLLEKRRRETGVYGGKVGKASDKEEEEEEIQGEEITKRKKKRKKKEEEIRVQGERGEEREERGGRRRISSSLHSPSVSVSSIPNSMTHNRVRHTPHADFLSLGKSKDVREEEEDEEKSRKGEKNAMESFLSSSSSSLGRKTPWLRVGLERKKREMKDESGPGEDRYEGEDRTEAKRQMEIANEREAKEEEERGELEGEKKEEEGGGELEISASTHSHRLIRHRDTFPRVCLLGRPNVGKSSLFNRLKREDRCASDSIVLDQEGTTRDRHYAFATWRERPFVVVDTGGLIFEEDRYAADLYADEIRIQVKEAVKETSCVLFLVDGRAGLDGEDEVIADFLRTCGKPVVVCVNKCENYQAGLAAAQEFWKLGLGQPFACSAVEGVGISDLLDRCFEYIPSIPFPSPPRQSLETSSSSSSSSSPSSPSSSSYRTSHTSPQPSIPPGTSPSQAPPLTSDGFLKEDINVAIIGRPNVGKSQLLNRLLGIPRSVVSPKAGTTRDAIDEIVERDRVVYRLVDTAGIRRARVVKAQKGTEYIMVKRAERV